jgi:hypothetical protein
MIYLLRYLDWIASIILPDHPNEHDLARARLMLLCTQILALVMIALLAAMCSQPHRFDPPRQQELQRQQEQCLARGGSPKECRP